jgi:hypothetical protein
MSTARKPRADASLKTLPEDRQLEIALHAQANTLDATVAWLRADGLKTSRSALSLFLQWHSARQRALVREQKVQAWLECEKLEHPELNDEDLFLRGQRKFSIISIAEEDPKGWAMIQKTARDKEAVALDRQKFQRETCALFVKWAADKRAAAIANSDTTNADKIEQLGQLMFGEDWKEQ